MGAFTLYKKNNPSIDIKKIRETFINKGFRKAPKEFDLQEYKLLYYSKIYTSVDSILEYNGQLLVGIGTYIYHKKWGKTALIEISKNIQNNTFFTDQVIGDFLILHFDGNKTYFYTSPNYSYNIFFDENETIISSSFLAVVNGLQHNFSLNKLALKETLLTGNLIGPDTLLNEVYRLEKTLSFKNHNIVHIHNTGNGTNIKAYKSFEQAVDSQLEVLENYFAQIKGFTLKTGICIGLTGGLDSRLLLASALNAGLSPLIYSTWRPIKDKEFVIAQKLAELEGHTIKSPKHTSFLELDNILLQKRLEENFWFNDGQVRTHQLWFEEIKSLPYLNELLNNNSLNTSGIGGEQYRNDERYNTRIKYNYDNWLKYEIILKNIDNPFFHQKGLFETYEYIKLKINTLLDKKDLKKISYYEIKRYFNEIYNPANRTVRNNIENQAYYFLSPFSDYTVSTEAYNSINWHGLDFKFEKRMIEKAFPKFSKIATNYGFAPNQKITHKQKFYSLFKSNTPLSFYWKLNQYRKIQQNKKDEFSKSFAWLDIKYFKYLPEDISLNRILENNYLSPLVYELAYFIKIFENKLK